MALMDSHLHPVYVGPQPPWTKTDASCITPAGSRTPAAVTPFMNHASALKAPPSSACGVPSTAAPLTGGGGGGAGGSLSRPFYMMDDQSLTLEGFALPPELPPAAAAGGSGPHVGMAAMSSQKPAYSQHQMSQQYASQHQQDLSQQLLSQQYIQQQYAGTPSQQLASAGGGGGYSLLPPPQLSALEMQYLAALQQQAVAAASQQQAQMQQLRPELPPITFQVCG